MIFWVKRDLLFEKFRGGFRTAATFKLERFVIIVNGWKPLTIITKRSILDVSAVLDPPLKLLPEKLFDPALFLSDPTSAHIDFICYIFLNFEPLNFFHCFHSHQYYLLHMQNKKVTVSNYFRGY